LEGLEDLAGQTVYVPDSSAFIQHLSTLSDSLQEAGLPPIDVVAADPNLEQEDILDMVNAGIYPFTMIKDYEAGVWRELADSIRIYEELPVYDQSEIAWAFRKNSPLLEELVNKFVAKHKQGTLLGNMLLNRYLKETGYLKKPLAASEREKFLAMRDIFQKYGEQYSFDWLLLAAQGYQESGFDQSKVSSAGAVGIMQIKPSTAADPSIGIQNVYDLENNIHAGAKYMRYIIDRYFNEEGLDTLNKGLLALASYNAGQNRLVRLRKQAAEEGLDSNVWFNNVELIAAREVGREPVQYVSNIYKYYLSYSLLDYQLEKSGERPLENTERNDR
jgi:membrane-bound lytic murein transglycosylase MltF